MKILMYEWNGIMQRDVKAVLREMGILGQVISYEISDDASESWFERKLRETIQNSSFDAVLSMHYFPVIAEVCHENQLTYIAWIYDCPFPCKRPDTLGYNEVYAYSFDKEQTEKYQKLGASYMQYLPLAVNCKRLDEIAFDKNDIQRYQAEVSFVGQLYQRKEGKPWKNDEIKDTYLERTTILNEISQFAHVKIFTADNTDDILPDVVNMGTAMYYTEMPKVFRMSKINLNMSLHSIHMGIPLRVLDIMGASGFVLSNRQPEIEDFFVVGQEIETYSSIDEAVEKAKYYLSHEDSRKKIALAGRKKVEQLFDFRVQIPNLLRLSGFNKF